MQRCGWPRWRKRAPFHPPWRRSGCLRVSEAVPGPWRWRTPPSDCTEPQVAGLASSPGPASSPGQVIPDSSRLSGGPGDSGLQSAHAASDGCHHGGIQVLRLSSKWLLEKRMKCLVFKVELKQLVFSRLKTSLLSLLRLLQFWKSG